MLLPIDAWGRHTSSGQNTPSSLIWENKGSRIAVYQVRYLARGVNHSLSRARLRIEIA